MYQPGGHSSEPEMAPRVHVPKAWCGIVTVPQVSQYPISPEIRDPQSQI